MQGLLQLQAWGLTKWSPINFFFSSQTLIFHQYLVLKIQFHHVILQDSIRAVDPGLQDPGLEL